MNNRRGLVIERFGDTPHLAVLHVPDLAPDQVLIAVRAASVNAFDWKAAEGRFKDNFEYQLNPGLERRAGHRGKPSPPGITGPVSSG